MKKLFNLYEIAEYRVVKDDSYTLLKSGDQFPAFNITLFGKEYVQLGCRWVDPQFFQFLLLTGHLERVLPDHYFSNLALPE